MTPEEKKRKKDDERRELAATVLFEATFKSDKEVAEKYDISERVIRDYRKRKATDPLLAGTLQRKLEAFEAAWADEMVSVMREGMETIKTITMNLRNDLNFKSNPGALKEVTESFMGVAEVYLTVKSIEAGKAPKQGADQRGEVHGAGVDGGDADRPN